MANVVGIVEQVQTGGDLYNVASTAYGYCETGASTAAKVVSIPGFTYITGVTIHVKFRYGNTAANPTLNVNSQTNGAKPIVLNGATADSVTATAAGTVNETSGWNPGAVLALTYDGTNWIRDQGYNTKNAGTVTSVQVQASSPLQSSTNTAQNSTLNTTISFTKQAHNTVLAGPSGTSDANAAPTFRSLVAADIPNLNTSKLTAGTLGVARGGTGASTFTTGEVLIGNGTSAVTTKAIDTTVTANSSNLVTSGAVATAISGLTGAMHFVGSATQTITDGGTEHPTTAGATYEGTAGDVVISGSKEYVWTGSAWELLGDEGSYALDSNVIHKSDYTAKGQIMYGKAATGDFSILAPNTSQTKKIMYMASSTPAWAILGISTTNHTAKAVTAVAYASGTSSSGTGTWPTLSRGTAFSIKGVDTVGSPTTAVVTDSVLIITEGTATTAKSAASIPNITGIDATNAKWPALSVTANTDFLTGAELTYT